MRKERMTHEELMEREECSLEYYETHVRNRNKTIEEQVDQLCEQILDDKLLSWERLAIAGALQERDRIARAEVFKQLMSLTRWKLESHSAYPEEGAWMEPYEKGDFIKFEDVEALLTPNKTVDNQEK